MKKLTYKFFKNRIDDLKRKRLDLIEERVRKEITEKILKKNLANLDDALATNINLMRTFDTEVSDIIA